MRKTACLVAILSLGSLSALAEGPLAKPAGTGWVGTWASAQMENGYHRGRPDPSDSTYRDIVHTSMAGRQFRVRITNEFGDAPLQVGAVHTALSAGNSANGAIETTTDHAVTFGGQAGVTIPTGAAVVSDPINMPLPSEANLAVSIYLPRQTIAVATCHDLAVSTNYVFPGNAVSSADAAAARKTTHWCFLSGVDVTPETRQKAAAIVTLGDSITDGAHSTPDTNQRWPDVLAARLQSNPETANLSVLNEGISGNCILSDDCAGPNALSRFDRDVLAESGVKYLIILEGINDIGHITRPNRPQDQVTADELILGLEQLVEFGHQHGIKVFGGTITPYQGAKYYSARGEQIREAVNHWIRTSGVFDGVIDFDKATRDPANPQTFAPRIGSTDDLHPGDAGYKIMGDSIDLKLFR